MKHYVDLVSVLFDGGTKEYLAVAPEFSSFKKGDEVVILMNNEYERATVIRSCTVAPNKEEYNFICGMFPYKPLQIVKSVEFKDINWDGYEEDKDE